MSRITRLFSTMHGLVAGNGADNPPAEKNVGGAKSGMNGGTEKVGIVGSNQFPFALAISTAFFVGFLDLGFHQVASNDGDAQDAVDQVTVDDVNSEEQCDVDDPDPDPDPDVPHGSAKG